MAADGSEHLGSGQLAESGPPLTVRAFFGLPVPEDQRQLLDAYLGQCAAAAPAFRWTPAANLHLTLRFLGQVQSALAEAIVDRLGARVLHGFNIELGELGTFKRGRLVRVVWLGPRAGADEARALAAAVEAECVVAGLATEERAFQPHLTLARARSRYGAPLAALVTPSRIPPWRADELVLYRSRLGRGGSVYEPLRKLRLS